MERDEEDLIRLSCQGDAGAFRALLDLHYQKTNVKPSSLCSHKEAANMPAQPQPGGGEYYQ